MGDQDVTRPGSATGWSARTAGASALLPSAFCRSCSLMVSVRPSRTSPHAAAISRNQRCDLARRGLQFASLVPHVAGNRLQLPRLSQSLANRYEITCAQTIAIALQETAKPCTIIAHHTGLLRDLLRCLSQSLAVCLPDERHLLPRWGTKAKVSLHEVTGPSGKEWKAGPRLESLLRFC